MGINVNITADEMRELQDCFRAHMSGRYSRLFIVMQASTPDIAFFFCYRDRQSLHLAPHAKKDIYLP